MTVDVPRMLAELGVRRVKRVGRELWACCPFPDHRDSDPSWSIVWNPAAPNNGFNKCWGCGREGGAVYLVMEVLDMSGYPAAHRWLEDNHLKLDGTQPLAADLVIRTPSTRGDSIELPADVRQEPLEQWVTPARRYAVNRGITAAQVGRWRLGYGTMGRCEGRLVVPVADRDGRLRNWTARSFIGQEPRYLNPETPEGADPSMVFGEAAWPDDAAGLVLVVTEGELNGLAIERVVSEDVYFGALGGSELNALQVAKIARFGRVVIARDPDPAGDALTSKLAASLKRWRGYDTIEFRPGTDACDAQPDRLRDAIARASTARRDRL